VYVDTNIWIDTLRRVTCRGSVQRFPPKVGADNKQRSGLSGRLGTEPARQLDVKPDN